MQIWSSGKAAVTIIFRSGAAMLGFVIGAYNEFHTSETIVQQAQRLSWPAFIVMGSFAYASPVPILKGAKREAFGKRALSIAVCCK